MVLETTDWGFRNQALSTWPTTQFDNSCLHGLSFPKNIFNRRWMSTWILNNSLLSPYPHHHEQPIRLKVFSLGSAATSRVSIWLTDWDFDSPSFSLNCKRRFGRIWRNKILSNLSHFTLISSISQGYFFLCFAIEKRPLTKWGSKSQTKNGKIQFIILKPHHISLSKQM